MRSNAVLHTVRGIVGRLGDLVGEIQTRVVVEEDAREQVVIGGPRMILHVDAQNGGARRTRVGGGGHLDLRRQHELSEIDVGDGGVVGGGGVGQRDRRGVLGQRRVFGAGGALQLQRVGKHGPRGGGGEGGANRQPLHHVAREARERVGDGVVHRRGVAIVVHELLERGVVGEVGQPALLEGGEIVAGDVGDGADGEVAHRRVREAVVRELFDLDDR